MLFNQTTYEDGTFLTYTVEDETKIDKHALNTVSQADIDGVLKLNREVDNGKTVFFINITSKVRLSMLLDKPVSRDFLFGILTSIAKISIEADDYLLNSKFFLFDYDDIYVDLADKKVSLIYLPIEREAEELDAKDFMKKLLFNLTYDTGEDSNYLAILINLINSKDAVSMEKMLETIEDIKKRGTRSNAGEKKDQAGANNAPAQFGKLQENPVQPGPNAPTPPAPGNAPVKRFDPMTGKPLVPMDGSTAPAPAPVPEKENKKSSLFGSMRGKNKDKDKDTAVPAANNAPAVQQGNAAQPPESEKKHGLFSKKQKPQPAVVPGINIPGQSPVPPQSNAPRANAQPQANVQQPYAQQPAQGGYAPLQSNYVSAGISPASQEGLSNTVILGGAAESGRTVFLNASETPGVAKITRVSTNETAVIKGNVFKIGKEKDYVDFLVSGNNTISRIHAQIRYENGQYFLEDINSLNHTYLGNDTQPIQSGQPYMLRSGMRFRLADEEFIFSLK